MSDWWKRLLKPSPSRSILSLLIVGGVLGVAGVMVFNVSMHATSTEEFCISCHEMEANPWAQMQRTSHFSNAAGLHATCSDCHLPKEFVPKMIRKVEASREVWGTLMGIIDTPEKYAAHTPKMKAREIARLQANDSQECRNCQTQFGSAPAFVRHQLHRSQLLLRLAGAPELPRQGSTSAPESATS